MKVVDRLPVVTYLTRCSYRSIRLHSSHPFPPCPVPDARSNGGSISPISILRGQEDCNATYPVPGAMLVPFVQARPTCCLHRILDIRVRKATRRPGSNQFLELGTLGRSGPSLTSAGRSLCDQAKSSSIRSTIRLTPSSRPISPVIQIWSQMGLKTSELTFSFSWKAGSSRA